MHILLVHGAFHDGQCWDVFKPQLEAIGTATHAVTLRGHGSRQLNAFRISMASYARDVCDAAQRIGEPCVLFGHSMGGFVITAAAEARPELFSHVIYLTAFAPPQRKTTLFALQNSCALRHMRAAARPALLKGHAAFDLESARDIFYNNCDAETQVRAITRLCPQPIRPSFSPVSWSEARLGALPKYYIECTQDNAFRLEDQRKMQQNMEFLKVATLGSDHSPFLSMPQQLASTVRDLLG
jgi:pimeloyl-ACP methyl ester carboxylesterase